jgi:hypothetical protein
MVGAKFFLGASIAVAALKSPTCDALLTAAPLPGAVQSQFIRDVALYLTGSDTEAEAVFAQFKKRTDPMDAEFPYPLQDGPPPKDWTTFSQSVDFNHETFLGPASAKWETSKSGLWKRRRITSSKVKGTSRVLFRSIPRNSSDSEISIAQTWKGPSIDSLTLRETEVAIQHSQSENWNFFVFKSDGTLSAQSTFVSSKGKEVIAPAPLSCLTCHYNREAGTFTRLPLSYESHGSD